MDEAVDIVLGNSIGNTLDTVDVDILVGEVPDIVRNHLFIYATHTATHLVGYWRPTRL